MISAFPDQTWSGTHEVGMPAKTDPRFQPADSEYFYRRALSARGALPAVGVGVAVGLAAFYLVRLYLERTPLTPGPARAARSRRGSQDVRTRHG